MRWLVAALTVVALAAAAGSAVLYVELDETRRALADLEERHSNHVRDLRSIRSSLRQIESDLVSLDRDVRRAESTANDALSEASYAYELACIVALIVDRRAMC